jgi:hypothetical protein
MSRKFRRIAPLILEGCLTLCPRLFTPGNEPWHSLCARLIRHPEPVWMDVEKIKFSYHCQGCNLGRSSCTVGSVSTALLWLPAHYCKVVYKPVHMKMYLKANEVRNLYSVTNGTFPYRTITNTKLIFIA